MKEISINEILISREERAKTQHALLDMYKKPLICFTMNIAGPTKNSPLITRAFNEGVNFLLNQIPHSTIEKKILRYEPTGCEMYLCADMEAQVLKSICTNIEEAHPLGRLFDMDVVTPDGTKLTRNKERSCIVCSSPGRVCAAGRVHSADEIFGVMTDIMKNYFLNIDAKTISHMAVKSLIDEVDTTPKPGLVDKNNTGSHSDMDRDMFIQSALCLGEYFKEVFLIGAKNHGKTPEEIFPVLKEAGIEAEKKMYTVTKGINTHKGMIYSMGIICASAGMEHTCERPFAPVDTILCTCAKLAKAGSLGRDTRTAKLCSKYNVGGIIGEAQSGFATAKNTGLETLKQLTAQGVDTLYAGAVTLLHLISRTEDTNLYHRGGAEGADFAREATENLLRKYPIPPIEQIEVLDNEFIKRNISPGGAADLLAISYFFYDIEQNTN